MTWRTVTHDLTSLGDYNVYRLTNGRTIIDGQIEAFQSLFIIDGKIRDQVNVPSVNAPAISEIDLEGDIILPGFIDVQVNGGGGYLFNQAPTVDTIKHIGAAHRRYGTTGFLPTLISDDIEVIDQAMRAVEAAIDAEVPGVLGIHIEGPFLNPSRRGIHPLEKIAKITDQAMDILCSLNTGKTLVTLAPDMVSDDQIKRLITAGVIVSLGHSDATAEQALKALDAGATGFTHLYNAMSQLSGRDPGMVGAALASPDSFAGIIVDTHHVDKVAIQAAINAKGTDRIMLVSDAMPTVGADLPTFDLMGTLITASNGKLMGPDGTLAGSHLDTGTAVRNVRNWLGLGLSAASEMASATPAAFLGLEGRLGSIKTGYDASLVRLDDALIVKATWINGEMESYDQV